MIKNIIFISALKLQKLFTSNSVLQSMAYQQSSNDLQQSLAIKRGWILIVIQERNVMKQIALSQEELTNSLDYFKSKYFINMAYWFPIKILLLSPK